MTSPKLTATEVFAEADANGWRRALVVTALPLETRAVRAHAQHLGHAVASDGSFLELGHFSAQGVDWLVVFAESGAGTHEAQGVVQNAFAEFGPFEISFFVGIAGGRKDEAIIGTVVASTELYNAGGGKWGDDGFNGRPDVRKVDTHLANLAKKVERDAEWQERIRAPLKTALPADDQYPKPRPPNALVAPIISVEAVSADPASPLEAQITKHYNDACAVEMEGYGFMFVAERQRTPGIVVRGISDQRKNKRPDLDEIHQPVAAAHAAAFAFAILDLWGGTYERQPIVARVPAPSRTHDRQAPALESPPPPAITARSTFVMNFKGSEADFPPERQAQILQTLREATGDDDLEIIGTEPGSFRLILSGSIDHRSRLDRPEIYQRLAENFQANLIGVVSERDYRSAPNDQASLALASGPVLDWPQTLPDDTWIERPELETLLRTIENDEGSTIALIGPAGSGKTALLGRFAHILRSQDVPFLAIKADLLDASVTTEEDLQRSLGLSETPSAVLTRLSWLRPAVLIIDQLDALAGYVDLRTGRLNVLLNLVRKLGTQQNIHIVLSARAFEYAHDTRLKSVQAESLSLELPAWTDILKILEANGIQAAGWPTDAQEVMRSPQALATFMLFADKDTIEPFLSYQAMLEKLWQERIVAQPNGGRVARLAGRIAEDMADRETLWLASSKYDDQAAELELLISNGILTHPSTPASIGFSHQTVFEYALARAFAQKEGRLSSYVLDREGSLFVRPKLWAALTYLRAVEPSTYLAELNAIWSHKSLRRHLRYLLIEFMGQQASPVEGEGTLMDQAMNSSDRRVSLQAIVGSAGWFQRYRRTSVPDAMMKPVEANVAAGILVRAWPSDPTNVTNLVESKWMPNKDFDGYAWAVLEEAPRWTEDHLQMACSIVSRTSISPYAFDHTVMAIGVDQPSFAVRLALARLKAEWQEALAEAERRAGLPKTENDQDYLANYNRLSPTEPLTEVIEKSDGFDGLEAVAKQDPQGYLDLMWPWFQEVLAAFRKYEDAEPDFGFPLHYALDFRFEEEASSLGLGEHPILGALRVAADHLATDDPKSFVAWLQKYGHEEATPAQRLFAHTLAVHAESLASTALDFVLSDKRRLHLGGIEDFEGTTKHLVRESALNWDSTQLDRFVSELRSYSPTPGSWRETPEQKRTFLRHVHRVKFQLLELLPQDRLSREVQGFVSEQRRRFGNPSSGAVFSGPSWIGPSMSAEELGLARDEDVVNAFQQLPDATGWDNPKSWMKGGNVQLSRAFADFAKAQPVRAVDLMRKMGPDIATRAAGYALDAMAEEADPNLILELIPELEARGFSGEEYRGSVARAIERLVRRKVKIDDPTVSLLTSWLSDGKNQPDPDDEVDDALEDDNSLQDLLPSSDKAKSDDREGSVLWGMGGLSILPHGNFPVLEVLTRIYLQRRDPDSLIALLANHLNCAEDEKVWAALLRLFAYIRPKDTKPYEEFLARLFARYPGFANTREAAIFLAYAHWVVPDFVRGVLLDWKTNPAALVQQAFGELATLVWLMQPTLEWPNEMIEEVLNAEQGRARVGATYAAVNVWAETEKKDRASQLLERVIPTADDATWSAVVDLFRLIDDIPPEPEWIRLLEAVAERIPSQSTFTSTFIVDRLQSLLPHQASLVAKIAKALTTKWRNELGDIRTGTAAVAPELVDIAITLHRLGPQTREAGIEVFEDLLDTNAYTASDTLSQIDNRFRTTAFPVRRRLPRRERRSRQSRRGKAQ